MDLYVASSQTLPHELCLELMKFMCMRNLRTYITRIGIDFEELSKLIVKYDGAMYSFLPLTCILNKLHLYRNEIMCMVVNSNKYNYWKEERKIFHQKTQSEISGVDPFPHIIWERQYRIKGELLFNIFGTNFISDKHVITSPIPIDLQMFYDRHYGRYCNVEDNIIHDTDLVPCKVIFDGNNVHVSDWNNLICQHINCNAMIFNTNVSNKMTTYVNSHIKTVLTAKYYRTFDKLMGPNYTNIPQSPKGMMRFIYEGLKYVKKHNLSTEGSESYPPMEFILKLIKEFLPDINPETVNETLIKMMNHFFIRLNLTTYHIEEYENLGFEFV